LDRERESVLAFKLVIIRGLVYIGVEKLDLRLLRRLQNR